MLHARRMFKRICYVAGFAFLAVSTAQPLHAKEDLSSHRGMKMSFGIADPARGLGVTAVRLDQQNATQRELATRKPLDEEKGRFAEKFEAGRSSARKP